MEKESIKSIKEFQEIAADKFEKITNLEKSLVSLEHQKEECQQRTCELEISEEKFKSELLKARAELSVEKRKFQDIERSIRDDIKKENRAFADGIFGLTLNLRREISRLRILANSEDGASGHGAEIIVDVVKAGTKIADAIDEYLEEKPF